MKINENTLRRIASLVIVLVMGILAFFVINPILLSLIAGLLLTYIFYPIFKKILSGVKNRILAATITLVIAIAFLLIPLWFVVPIIFKQLFQIYIASQNIDISQLLVSVMPTASPQFITQATLTINAGISKVTSSLLNRLAVDYTNINTIFLFILKIAVIAIVFFFALKDNESLKKFVSAISPLSKSREKLLVGQFKDITNSILYGQVVIGFLQGLLAGLGLIIFGIPNAFALTAVAIVLAIIPFIGTPLIWIPATIYLFASGHPTAAIIYLIYNLLIVSTVDNILKAYIVSKRSNVSQVIILIGMVGGVMLFGVLGLILGPLILAYFLTFLTLHRDKNSKGNVFS